MSASKLTDETLNKIAYYIENGTDTTSAAIYAGVSRSATNGWRTQGNKCLKQFDGDVEAVKEWIDTHDDMTKHDKERTWMCVKYVCMVRRAKVDCVAPVEFKAREIALSGEDPTFMLKWLARKHPETWDEKRTLRIEGETTHVIKQIVIHGSEETPLLEKRNPVDVDFVEVDDGSETEEVY